MFAFEDPICLVLLIPVSLLAVRLWGRRSPGGIRFASFSGMPEHGVTWRIVVARVAPVAFVSALTLLVVALAQPRLISSTELRKTDAVAIEVVLDISGSMDRAAVEEDGEGRTGGEPVSRLDVVKESLSRFVEARTDDLIGLVTFAGYVETRAPLTIDHDALLSLLGGIEVPGHAATGEYVVGREELLTAIGDALAVACARLKDAEVRSKIIILLTDGGSNAGIVDPETGMKLAGRLGIRVYTIGVGAADRMAPSDGSVHPDVALLKLISDFTGGLYFDAGSPGELSHVLSSIDALEKTEVETILHRRSMSLFQVFLVPALILFILAVTSSIIISRRII